MNWPLAKSAAFYLDDKTGSNCWDQHPFQTLFIVFDTNHRIVFSLLSEITPKINQTRDSWGLYGYTRELYRGIELGSKREHYVGLIPLSYIGAQAGELYRRYT